jgi:hypothetical protein
MMLSDENSIFFNVVNTSSPLFFDDADLTIQRTAKSAEAACVGNNLNITPVLDVCTSTSFTAIGVLAAAQRKHNNQHPPKRLDVAFFLLPFNGSPVLNAPPRYFYETAATLQANAPLTTSLLLHSFNLFHSHLSPLLLL